MVKREEAYDDGWDKAKMTSVQSTRVNGSQYIRRNPSFHDFLRHSVQSTAICDWVIFVHGEIEPISTVDLSVYKAGADNVPLHIYDSVGPLSS